MLTSHQLTYYKTFGVLILRDFLKSDEIAKINSEFESKLTNTLRSTTTPGHRNYVSWPNLGPDTPYSGSLLEDERICNIAEQLLGGEIYGVSCNRYADILPSLRLHILFQSHHTIDEKTLLGLGSVLIC